MVTLEQVELLRTKADVTYEEARQALEATNGDLLDAVVLLEIQGKVRPPKVGPARQEQPVEEPLKASSAKKDDTSESGSSRQEKTQHASPSGTDVGSLFHKIWSGIKRLVQLGNRNNIVVSRGTQTVLTLPITALVLLLIIFNWAAVVLIVIGMFTGFRFVFSGPDIHDDTANTIMNSAADAAESLKREVGTAINKDQNKDSSRH